MISVIIPTYQHAATLPACLDSIFAQTFQDIEIIVVDDGSTDNTQEVLKPYRERLQIIRQENRGSNAARMRGFERARGDELIFCDADAVLKPQMLERLHSALGKNPEASYAYCAFQFGWKTFRGLPFSYERLKRYNYIHTTSLIRRKDFPGFDLTIKRLQDWDVWLSLLAKGKFGVLVPELLFSITVEGHSRIGSAWLPSWMYRLPWSKIGWKPKRLAKYEEARKILMKKHGL